MKTKQKIFNYLLTFWFVLALVLIPLFFLGYTFFRATGNLTIIGVVMGLAAVGLAGVIVTIIAKNNQREDK